MKEFLFLFKMSFHKVIVFLLDELTLWTTPWTASQIDPAPDSDSDQLREFGQHA